MTDNAPLIEEMAVAIAYAGRHQRDVSRNAKEFWNHTGSYGRSEARVLAHAALSVIDAAITSNGGIEKFERLLSAARAIDLGRSIHNERLPNGADPLNGGAWDELREAIHAAGTITCS